MEKEHVEYKVGDHVKFFSETTGNGYGIIRKKNPIDKIFVYAIEIIKCENTDIHKHDCNGNVPNNNGRWFYNKNIVGLCEYRIGDFIKFDSFYVGVGVGKIIAEDKETVFWGVEVSSLEDNHLMSSLHKCSGRVPSGNGLWVHPYEITGYAEPPTNVDTTPLIPIPDNEEKDILDFFDQHYQGDIQPIEIMQAQMTSEEFRGYLKGNIIKYVCRLGKKDDPKKESAKIYRYAEWLKDFIHNGKIELEKNKE